MKPVKIGSLTLPHPLILAPMCGITNLPFRLICKELGAGFVFNQMVSAKALTMKDKKSMGMLKFLESERPIGMQVFGNDADVLSEAALIIQEKKPDLIDLNLGCPAKKIVNDGGGSALLTDPEKLKLILKKMREAIKIPFTVKIRAGWDSKSLNALEIAKMAQDYGVDAITIHARTRTQAYKGSADWSIIKNIKDNLSIPVIGNGDIKKASDVNRMMSETGCDAVMTGRAAFATPWIFQNYLNQTDSSPTQTEIKNIILKHYQLSMNHFGDKQGIKIMRKFICAYTKGMRDGAKLRNDIVRMDEWDKIQNTLNVFFNVPV